MTSVRLLPAILVLSLSMAPGSFGQTSGVAAEWDVQKSMDALSKTAQRLKPVLEGINPQEWVSKGASDGFVTQWKSTRAEIDYLGITAEKLARNPEKLSLALETLFRLESLEQMLHSLIEGVRRYQNPALADLVQGLASETSAHHARLRQYVVDLAQVKEEEFRIADREAQRCRSQLARQPAPQGKTKAAPAPLQPAAKPNSKGERK